MSKVAKLGQNEALQELSLEEWMEKLGLAKNEEEMLLVLRGLKDSEDSEDSEGKIDKYRAKLRGLIKIIKFKSLKSESEIIKELVEEKKGLDEFLESRKISVNGEHLESEIIVLTSEYSKKKK